MQFLSAGFDFQLNYAHFIIRARIVFVHPFDHQDRHFFAREHYRLESIGQVIDVKDLNLLNLGTSGRLPVLVKKFEAAIAAKLSPKKCAVLNALCGDQARLEATPVNAFMELFAV